MVIFNPFRHLRTSLNPDVTCLILQPQNVALLPCLKIFVLQKYGFSESCWYLYAVFLY